MLALNKRTRLRDVARACLSISTSTHRANASKYHAKTFEHDTRKAQRTHYSNMSATTSPSSPLIRPCTFPRVGGPSSTQTLATTARATDSPFQPRNLKREEARNDLQAYAAQMQEDNYLFAQAVEARDRARNGEIPATVSPLSSRPQLLWEQREAKEKGKIECGEGGQGGTGKVVVTPSLRTLVSEEPDEQGDDEQEAMVSGAVPNESDGIEDNRQVETLITAYHESAVSTTTRSGRDLLQRQAHYARRMAESTLTQNGRVLMSKATTKVSKTSIVCRGSCYTRGCGEVLREVLVGRRGRGESEAERLLGGGGDG